MKTNINAEHKLTHFCEEQFQKQCLLKHGSAGCKLRYQRGQCSMALKEKQKEYKNCYSEGVKL